MGEHVSIEQQHVVRIDVAGWIAQRTGSEHPDLTAALRDWGHAEELTHQLGMDWMSWAQVWCAAREYPIEAGSTVHHDHPWLSRPVSAARAWTEGYGAIAIVSVDGHAPRVYADITTDDGSWYQVDTLDIVCPGGHTWTWHGNNLTTPHGASTTVAEVFGDAPHTPFTPCPGCLAYDGGDTDTPCPCPGTDRIVCPHCGGRCDLRLTPVPTRPVPVATDEPSANATAASNPALQQLRADLRDYLIGRFRADEISRDDLNAVLRRFGLPTCEAPIRVRYVLSGHVEIEVIADARLDRGRFTGGVDLAEIDLVVDGSATHDATVTVYPSAPVGLVLYTVRGHYDVTAPDPASAASDAISSLYPDLSDLVGQVREGTDHFDVRVRTQVR
jgi:hypothetical protein